MKKVGLIGVGNMGEAMLRGWLSSGFLDKNNIVACEKIDEKRKNIADKYSIHVLETPGATAELADIIVLAVKPQDSKEVLENIAHYLDARKCLVSIAAGLSIASIRKLIGTKACVVRVMPNICARSLASVSAYSVSMGDHKFNLDDIKRLLGAFGEAIEVAEDWMNLITAISGSGPAYFFYLTEALENAAVLFGLDKDAAELLARETLWGAGKLLKESGSSPHDLRMAVSSPGGTTVAAIRELEDGGFAELIKRAVHKAMNRAKELAE